MLQQEAPEDYVLSTNETHSVREFVEKAFAVVNRAIRYPANVARLIQARWEGSGLEERGTDAQTGQTLVRIDTAYHRPTEVDLLLGDSSKARQNLKWRNKVAFPDLVREMVLADIEMAKRGSRL